MKKPDLSELTINQLSELTGSTYRTVKKRLADLAPVRVTANASYYSARDALPLIYLGDDNGEKLDLSQERAQLARVQTERQALLLERDKGSLLPAEKVEHVWGLMIMAFRARCLAIPTKCAPLVLAAESIPEASEILRVHVYEALNELSQVDVENYRQ